MTGRKIIVDTYGGYSCHAGALLLLVSDAHQVDRSRFMQPLVTLLKIAAGLASNWLMIGVAHPASVRIDTFGTSTLS